MNLKPTGLKLNKLAEPHSGRSKLSASVAILVLHVAAPRWQLYFILRYFSQKVLLSISFKAAN